MNQYKQFTELADSDAQLRRVRRQIAELNTLLRIVQGAVPQPLARCCEAVSWSGSTLLVAVPMSAAAARLRQCEADILQALAQSGWHATAILPRVQVASQVGNPNRTKTLHLSEAACSAFGALAEEVGDEGLRRSLQALLRHHQR